MSRTSECSGYSEYHDVIRVGNDTQMPHGYKFIADGEYPLPAFQYARDMTLARGRILYEVWNIWQHNFLGYIVPHTIFNEALSNRDGSSLTAWHSLPSNRRLLHLQIYRLILDRFPRIALFSAKHITENLMYDRKNVPPFRIVEEAIIQHVREYWTSHEFRIASKGQGSWEAKEAVKGRMREVLESWLPLHSEWTGLITLLRKHDLLDREDPKVKEGSWREKDVLYWPSAVQWFGGAETNANLIHEAHARL